MNGKMRELSRLHDDHVALMRDLAEKEEGSRQKRLQLSQAQSELSSYVRGVMRFIEEQIQTGLVSDKFYQEITELQSQLTQFTHEAEEEEHSLEKERTRIQEEMEEAERAYGRKVREVDERTEGGRNDDEGDQNRIGRGPDRGGCLRERRRGVLAD